MTANSETLYKCAKRDIYPDFPTMVDYFGDALGDHEKENVVLGMYRGLVIGKGVKADLLQNCFLSKRLNKLVHAKYKHHPSGYYDMFCALGIDLTPRTVPKRIPKAEWMKIYDDDHCPKCHTPGYNTQGNRDGLIDCEKCLQWMCKFCVGVDWKCRECSENQK
jgi:hypothetical protein